MMKLKHLFGNVELAQMLLHNWQISRGHAQRIAHFRSSANSVYTLECDAGAFFLRVTPADEKTPPTIQAELHFLRYLHTQGYPAVQFIPTAKGHDFVTADTPWGPHSMVVFEKAPGKPLEQTPYSDEAFAKYGQALGRLHHLSQAYAPADIQRPDWRERLDWCARVLRQYAAPKEALSEIEMLRAFLGRLPRTPATYGLIHYDFELDNVFYDSAQHRVTPIDFDDAMIHWYALDVEQSLDSISADVEPSHKTQAIQSFLAGYQSEMPDEAMLAYRPAFRRFINLYGYARCLRSVHETWENEPRWMAGLRKHIQTRMTNTQQCFGDALM